MYRVTHSSEQVQCLARLGAQRSPLGNTSSWCEYIRKGIESHERVARSCGLRSDCTATSVYSRVYSALSYGS